MNDTKINRAYQFWFTKAKFFFALAFRAHARYVVLFCISLFCNIYSVFLYSVLYWVSTFWAYRSAPFGPTALHLLGVAVSTFWAYGQHLLGLPLCPFWAYRHQQKTPTMRPAFLKKKIKSTSLNLGKYQQKTATMRRPFNNCFNQNPNYLFCMLAAKVKKRRRPFGQRLR